MLISQTQKAIDYSHESDRFHFCSFSVCLKGNHSSHIVAYSLGKWRCNCERFSHCKDCAHVHATWRLMEREVGVNLVGVPSGVVEPFVLSDWGSLIQNQGVFRMIQHSTITLE